MNCSRCNKQGAKPYKYNNGGVITDVFLCDDCYAFLSSPESVSAGDARRRAEYKDNVPQRPAQNARANADGATENPNADGRTSVREKQANGQTEKQTDKTPARKTGSILGLETKCPTCGASFSEIKRTGFLGCADCFVFFKNRLETVIDKFQGGVISNREKKQFEMTVMMLEHEYMTLSERLVEDNSEGIRRRMNEIEQRLASMGVRVDV